MEEGLNLIEKLEKGAESFACGGYLARLQPLDQLEILASLCHERLMRKVEDIHNIYMASFENWNDTFYTMLLKFLGAPNNSKAFETLASRVRYKYILRHNDNQQTLEALFLGTSGLLDCYRTDEYTAKLKSEFSYLSHKYKIEPMSPTEWVTRRIYPHNHPVLRMAQAAAFFTRHDSAIDGMMSCCTPQDVTNLFYVEASKYWANHFLPAHDSKEHIKRIGVFKSNILGINVVSQMQYAYGRYTNNDELCAQALNLLESIPAESNSKVNRWTMYGVVPHNALETQALIQLGDCYCKLKRCEECPIGRRIIKSAKSYL